MAPRILTLAFALTLLASVVPAAQADHSPGGREHDHRVLLDWTSPQGEYVSPAGAAGPSHDLLSVDVREAYLAPGTDPALFFRITVQGGDVTQGDLRDVLVFKVNGTEKRFTIQTVDNTAFIADFDELADPITVGSTKVLEGMVRYSTLGAKMGDKITGMSMQAYAGQDKGDYAPGGFYTPPDDPRPAVDVTPPGAADNSVVKDYEIKGPPKLIKATGGPYTVQAGGRNTSTLVVDNVLKNFSQDVFISINVPSGLGASLDVTAFTLPAGKSTTVNMTFVAVTTFAGGDITLTFDTSLGSRSTASFRVNATPAPAPKPEPEVVPEESTAPSPEPSPTPEQSATEAPANETATAKNLAEPQGAPSVGLVIGAGVLALAAIILRRRQ